jgi:methylthioribose-1-phosphate isomerase
MDDLTLWLEGDRVLTLDQTLLPFQQTVIELTCWQDCARAIATMQVRGAPLIGVVAAYGVALGLRERLEPVAIASIAQALINTRPTAVNLRWAVDRVLGEVQKWPEAQRPEAAWQAACQIRDEDIACNAAIGRHGAQLWAPLLERANLAGRPLQVLTHCNAGALATVALGTALAPIYQLHQAGQPLHVWVDETRPRNQGASLTAWELQRAGVAHTVVADNAGGLLMMQGQVDVVIVGCDRVTANGDVVNKVGTYLKALAARAHGVPFHVACPTSTIDSHTATGLDVEIESRDPEELLFMHGSDGSGILRRVRVVSPGSMALNPAFDITPAGLVDALITEHGVR